MIKLLLTSSGISNQAIKEGLEQLLGKSISESNALFVPTGVYPFVGGPNYAWWPIAGEKKSHLVDLGWKSMGLLELTALESIEKEVWLSSIHQADALLVWGGDPLYLAYWFERSGLGEVLKSLEKDLVYVGVSAGSMTACAIIGETYRDKRSGAGTPLYAEEAIFVTKQGEVKTNIVIANGIGLTDFAIIPHYNNPDNEDASGQNIELWAASISARVYALGEQAAILIANDKLEIIGGGEWKIFDDKTRR